jgi:C-terminal processing protease CtpA/Prc
VAVGLGRRPHELAAFIPHRGAAGARRLANLAPKGDVIVLEELSSSGAAAKAGLVPGDAILAIDGKPVADYGGFGDAVQRIRGAEGTVVVLRVRHADGSETDARLTRTLVRGP